MSDLFDDPFADELAKPAEPRSQAREGLWIPKPGQTDRHHLCCVGECQMWGAWGLGPQDAARTLWFCDAHRPVDYFTRKL